MRVFCVRAARQEGFTVQVKASNRHGSFEVSDDGTRLTARAGTGLLVGVADKLGLTGGWSEAAGAVRSWQEHDPGVVLRDVAVMLADGGTALRDLDAYRHQHVLFGQVASAPTACRTIGAVAEDPEVIAGLAEARRAARAHAWEAGAAPPVVARAADPETEDPTEPLALDLDATIIEAGSDDKEGAAPTFKATFGFHPILACLDRGDGRGEALAALLRPGNAGANTAADNIAVLDKALAQLPELPEDLTVLIRGDVGLATHAFTGRVRALGHRFSVSYEVTDAVVAAIRGLEEADWSPAVRQDNTLRPGAAVAEITDRVALAEDWPSRSRLIVRREPLHPGAQQTIADYDGFRFTVLLTDQQDEGPATLDRRHRARAHIEDRIRIAKDTGLRKLPCERFERNELWVQLVMAAIDLLAFTQALTLDDVAALRVAEPKTLRHRLLHAPARIVRHARRSAVKIFEDFVHATDLVVAYARLQAIPAPAT